MVVLEVSLPSGYTTDSSAFAKLESVNNVKKIETTKGDTVVVVYIDSMNVTETICPVVDGFRVQKVTDQKPSTVVIYDYYDSCAYLHLLFPRSFNF